MLDDMRRLAPLAATSPRWRRRVVTAVIGVIEARAHIPTSRCSTWSPSSAPRPGSAGVRRSSRRSRRSWPSTGSSSAPVHTFTIGDQNEWFALVLFIVTAVITGQLAADQRARAGEAADRAREADADVRHRPDARRPRPRRGARLVTERLREALGVAAAVVELDGDGASPTDRGRRRSDVRRRGARLARGVDHLVEPEDAASARWIRVVDPRGTGKGRVTSACTPFPSAPTVAASGRSRYAANASPQRGRRPHAARRGGAARERDRTGAPPQRATDAEILRRADELKNALLSAVSHDLRTPLASIIASAGSLRQTDVLWTDAERESSSPTSSRRRAASTASSAICSTCRAWSRARCVRSAAGTTSPR